MKSGEEARRTYVSPLRQQQAEATQWTILQAAARVFAECGYAGTSLTDIARAAGVGRATVTTAVGPKPVLLKRAYDTALAGDNDPTPIAQRATTRSFRDQADPYDVLQAYAGHATVISARIAGLAEAIRGAAGADPDARALWTTIQEQRYRGARIVVDAVLAVGALREGVTPDDAADLIWLLSDATLYHSLHQARGWSRQRIEQWRATTWQDQLLPTRPDRPS